MHLAKLIEHFHQESELCSQAFQGTDEARAAVAEALFTVAVGRKLAAEGPKELAELLRLLLAKIEPMAATDETIELLRADPSLLRTFLH